MNVDNTHLTGNPQCSTVAFNYNLFLQRLQFQYYTRILPEHHKVYKYTQPFKLSKQKHYKAYS